MCMYWDDQTPPDINIIKYQKTKNTKKEKNKKGKK